jgi:hypothetical protein
MNGIKKGLRLSPPTISYILYNHRDVNLKIKFQVQRIVNGFPERISESIDHPRLRFQPMNEYRTN